MKILFLVLSLFATIYVVYVIATWIVKRGKTVRIKQIVVGSYSELLDEKHKFFSGIVSRERGKLMIRTDNAVERFPRFT